MNTVQAETQGGARSTYVNVEQITSADFYTTGARNVAYALVRTSDSREHRVESPHVHALEQWFQRSQLVEQP